MRSTTAQGFIVHAGVPAWIDDAPAIAHSRVIVIDGTRVVTGSFNFTTAADSRNAKNVVVVRSPEVATWFGRNWAERRIASRVFQAE